MRAGDIRPGMELAFRRGPWERAVQVVPVAPPAAGKVRVRVCLVPAAFAPRWPGGLRVGEVIELPTRHLAGPWEAVLAAQNARTAVHDGAVTEHRQKHEGARQH